MYLPSDIIIGPFFRSFGPLGSRELIGGGFMHKDGVRIDHVDYLAQSYSLVYIVQGNGSYQDASGRVFRLRAGDYFQRIPGHLHSTMLEPSSDWWECFVDFGPSLCSALISMNIIDPQRPTGTIGRAAHWVEAFNRFHHELKDVSEPQLGTLLPKGLDLAVKVLASGRQEEDLQTQAMIAEACEMLRDDPSGRRSLRELCGRQGWGYELFRKRFVAVMGVSPGQFRVRARIDRARNLLRARPDLQIGEIARRLGYGNLYEFSAQFKKHTGLSPRQFRHG